jgi:acetyl-CoA carboxylase carboxyltransferase component
VPKIAICTHKAYGGSEISMCSRSMGADLYMAWPCADLAVMGAEGACAIIFRRDIAEAADPDAKRQELADHYRDTFGKPYYAASGGFVDMIIKPRDTRYEVIKALEALKDKKDDLPWKKHGNIPL